MPLSILSLSLSGCSRSCLRQRQQRQPVNTYTHSTGTHIHPRLLTYLTALLMRCNTGLLYLNSIDPMHLLHESVSNLQKANNVLSIVSVETDRPQVRRPTAPASQPRRPTTPQRRPPRSAGRSPRSAGHPQGVALLYTACARPVSNVGVESYYSRATPCGWPALRVICRCAWPCGA